LPPTRAVADVLGTPAFGTAVLQTLTMGVVYLSAPYREASFRRSATLAAVRLEGSDPKRAVT
jgi:hypothetical protein